MSPVILRRTRQSTVSVEEALALVKSARRCRVLSHSGNQMLVEMDLAQLAPLQGHLPGWILSPQSEPIRVPDTRLRIRTAAR